MSAPHRGLPPPAAMSLPPQQPPSSHPPPHPSAHQPPPPIHHSQQHSSMPPQPPGPSHHHRDSWTSAPAPAGPAPLPPPPQHWTNSDESMRNWLQAKAEEEKTKQEEERTRQEGLRLEQRKIEMDMLRSSIGGGIPPPMIPLVFAGMANGGMLNQAALEWAQQFMSSQSQYPQLPPPPRTLSPESQREAASQVPGQYHPSNAPMPPHGGSAYPAYAASPTRARGQTVSGIMGRPGGGSNISSAGSNTPQSAQGLQASTSTLGPFQPHQSGGGQSGHDSSTSIYFHHWQPPATQAGQSSGSNRPSSPSGESQKKRKAGADAPHHSRTSSTQRPRSPPSFIQSDFGTSGRKSHKRHKSDVSWYHGPRHSMAPVAEAPHRARTPAQDNSSTSSKDREAEGVRRDSQPETYSRLRHEDDGQSRERVDRERDTGSGERPA